MPQMTDFELRALLSAQYSSALASSNASKLSSEREKALSYYNGDLSEDLPAATGRSQAVSMDVSDTIEGIMPQLMEIFAGTDDVVKFDPVGPEDVDAAEQETEYINHVFMNQNPGFMVLYSFIKDALLSKTGIVKVWWDKYEKEENETYYDKTPDEYALIAASPEVEVTELTEHDGLYDVTVTQKKDYSKACAMAVPPEEFGIEANARDIRNCNYCFHRIVTETEADLIAQGYDAIQVKNLQTYRPWINTEETARDTVNEDTQNQANATPSTRRVETVEHYIRMDYKGNGKPCLYKVRSGGKEGEVLKLNGQPDVVEFDAIPFAAITPIIVTHRFYGKSLADLVMDIAKIKTALLRALLDNAYLANNPRTEVSEAHASANTLDDLLVSRPGGIVRVKQPGGIQPFQHVDVGSHVYPLLQYQDATREWRTGVTRQGQGIDANALQNQSATAVNQLFTAAQARVRLIARIFAETGIKDLFWLLHATVKKHGDKAQTVRLRNNWVTVDPREWKTRDDLTVNVGLGTGSKEVHIAMWKLLVGAQQQAVQAGLVSKRNLWNSAKELVKLIGRKDPESFFVNPGEQQPQQDPNSEPIQPPPDPKLQIEQIRSQSDMQVQQSEQQSNMARAHAEISKAQADAQVKIIEANARIHEAQMQQQLAAAQIQVDQLKAAAANQTTMDKAAIDNLVKLEVARIMASRDTDPKPDQLEGALSADAGIG